MTQTTYRNLTITALGHDGFSLNQDGLKRLAFDPYDLAEGEPADYIFISHPHFDHCDPQAIRKFCEEKTKIVAPVSCRRELDEFTNRLELVADNKKHQLPGLTYWTIPAYNLDKFRTPTEVFHPRDFGGVGFVVELEDRTRIYHAGDTDLIPEMGRLKKIDLAFLPISGTFVMTLEEAIKAARLIKPKLVIPMHFGKLLGSVLDANRFAQELGGEIPVTVLTAKS